MVSFFFVSLFVFYTFFCYSIIVIPFLHKDLICNSFSFLHMKATHTYIYIYRYVYVHILQISTSFLPRCAGHKKVVIFQQQPVFHFILAEVIKAVCIDHGQAGLRKKCQGQITPEPPSRKSVALEEY